MKQRQGVYNTGLRSMVGLDHISRKTLLLITMVLSITAILLIWQIASVFPNKLSALAERRIYLTVTPTEMVYVTSVPIIDKGMLLLNKAPDDYIVPTLKPGTCYSDSSTC